jgi:hypothetical protein
VGKASGRGLAQQGDDNAPDGARSSPLAAPGPRPRSRSGRPCAPVRPAPAPGTAHRVRRPRPGPHRWCGPAEGPTRARPGVLAVAAWRAVEGDARGAGGWLGRWWGAASVREAGAGHAHQQLQRPQQCHRGQSGEELGGQPVGASSAPASSSAQRTTPLCVSVSGAAHGIHWTGLGRCLRPDARSAVKH